MCNLFTHKHQSLLCLAFMPSSQEYRLSSKQQSGFRKSSALCFESRHGVPGVGQKEDFPEGDVSRGTGWL